MTRRITLNPRIGNQSTLDWNHNWIVVKEGTELKEFKGEKTNQWNYRYTCLLYTSPSPRDRQKSRMPSSA